MNKTYKWIIEEQGIFNFDRINIFFEEIKEANPNFTIKESIEEAIYYFLEESNNPYPPIGVMENIINDFIKWKGNDYDYENDIDLDGWSDY